MDRALVYETKGCRFESCLAHRSVNGAFFHLEEAKYVRRIQTLCVAILVLVLLTGCFAGPASRFTDDQPASFFAGVWHGLLAPFTLIASFLTDRVTMYEVHNVGPQYDMGFLFGVVVLVLSPAVARAFRNWMR